ncbi:hypothetical protein RND71_000889 [Anisodus tanguticus]|uniref:Uncharacterized protein n=1 Tax=Anisodus tanguticus TaxID=243964 RepID=A0AAE1VRR0_9SOLA|nr:hypothetical protein RND71_000889 [Anisodus tanguticus]
MAFELASLVPKLGSLGTTDHASVVSINLFVALLCACIIIGHLLEENRWINESITAVIIVSVTPFILHRGFHGKTYNADGVKISKLVKYPRFGHRSCYLAHKWGKELTPSGVQ